jgi:hypothetical protein
VGCTVPPGIRNFGLFLEDFPNMRRYFDRIWTEALQFEGATGERARALATASTLNARGELLDCEAGTRSNENRTHLNIGHIQRQREEECEK